MISKAKLFAKHYGGTWTYQHMMTWQCNDGRTIRKCAPSVDEFDNPMGQGQWYMYFPDNRPTKQIDFLGQRLLLELPQ